MDITDLVGDWHSAGLRNKGVLLSLSEDQERFGSSGPAFPSSRHPDASLRPRLTVWYLPDPG